jgi:hypothetical protein
MHIGKSKKYNPYLWPVTDIDNGLDMISTSCNRRSGVYLRGRIHTSNPRVVDGGCARLVSNPTSIDSLFDKLHQVNAVGMTNLTYK